MEGNWKRFFELRERVLELVEKLKEGGEIKDSREVLVNLPKDEWIEGFEMEKFLNVAEIRETKGKLSVEKSGLERCARCQRLKGGIGIGGLCPRCLEAIPENRGDMSIDDYVKSFGLDEEEEVKMIEYLKVKEKIGE